MKPTAKLLFAGNTELSSIPNPMPARLSPPGTHTLLSSHPPRLFWGFPSLFLSSKGCSRWDPHVAQTRTGFFPVGNFRAHPVPLVTASRAGARQNQLQQNRVPELTKGRWEGHIHSITEKLDFTGKKTQVQWQTLQKQARCCSPRELLLPHAPGTESLPTAHSLLPVLNSVTPLGPVNQKWGKLKSLNSQENCAIRGRGAWRLSFSSSGKLQPNSPS